MSIEIAARKLAALKPRSEVRGAVSRFDLSFSYPTVSVYKVLARQLLRGKKIQMELSFAFRYV